MTELPSGEPLVSGGFDCSRLTKAAYAAAGITLPRVAQDQYNAGPRVPADAPLLPGDLVFYGTPSNVHHVGLYIGSGHMINAPRPARRCAWSDTATPATIISVRLAQLRAGCRLAFRRVPFSLTLAFVRPKGTER
ncbi:C40 family peptidase [Streptomyces sp. DG2A-72]|uniref:C40 family peptidase n=1 Tax=Streptomyces sp. DG2A-72 TaxID=3051386 RepID=UPI0034649A2E